MQKNNLISDAGFALVVIGCFLINILCCNIVASKVSTSNDRVAALEQLNDELQGEIGSITDALEEQKVENASITDAYEELKKELDERQEVVIEENTEEDLKSCIPDSVRLEIEEQEYVIASTYTSSEAVSEEVEENTNFDVYYEVEEESDGNYTYYGVKELTAYIATGNTCADGVMPQVGYTVASNDPALWHKWIYIEGVGDRYVHDTGGMSSSVVDIFVGSYSEAIQFGRQSAKIYVYN